MTCSVTRFTQKLFGCDPASSAPLPLSTTQEVENYEYEMPSDFEDEEIDEDNAFTAEDKKKYGAWFGDDDGDDGDEGEDDGGEDDLGEDEEGFDDEDLDEAAAAEDDAEGSAGEDDLDEVGSDQGCWG